jgi:hypothetical protein
MTALSERKTRLQVETANTVWERHTDRPILVELRPAYMVLRLKGTQRRYSVTYRACLDLAINLERSECRREREQKRTKKGKS